MTKSVVASYMSKQLDYFTQVPQPKLKSQTVHVDTGRRILHFMAREDYHLYKIIKKVEAIEACKFEEVLFRKLVKFNTEEKVHSDAQRQDFKEPTLELRVVPDESEDGLMYIGAREH